MYMRVNPGVAPGLLPIYKTGANKIRGGRTKTDHPPSPLPSSAEPGVPLLAAGEISTTFASIMFWEHEVQPRDEFLSKRKTAVTPAKIQSCDSNSHTTIATSQEDAISFVVSLTK